jgi:hypothetical protein
MSLRPERPRPTSPPEASREGRFRLSLCATLAQDNSGASPPCRSELCEGADALPHSSRASSTLFSAAVMKVAFFGIAIEDFV